MSDIDVDTTITQAEFLAAVRDRFGPDPMRWAFVCPSCEDVATGADVRAALTEHPRVRKDGAPVVASDILGTECIGRTLGALHTTDAAWAAARHRGEARGCSWAAYGLFRGPLLVIADNGSEIAAFRPAPATVNA